MQTILRFKELPPNGFGFCELCNIKPARVYAITDISKATPASFLCRECVTTDAVEIAAHQDVFA